MAKKSKFKVELIKGGNVTDGDDVKPSRHDEEGEREHEARPLSTASDKDGPGRASWQCPDCKVRMGANTDRGREKELLETMKKRHLGGECPGKKREKTPEVQGRGM